MQNIKTQPLLFRAKLAALWCSLMFLYLYADVFSFYRPGVVSKIQDGMMGPFAATQSSLLVAALLMLIPSLMIAASFFFSISLTRKLHVVVAGLFTLVNVANLMGESWLYYLAYGVVEIALTLAIATVAIRSTFPDLAKD